jgi:hypothetical protein
LFGKKPVQRLSQQGADAAQTAWRAKLPLGTPQPQVQVHQHGAFKGGGGELRYIDQGATCVIQGDTNGDRIADLEIRVNIAALNTGDFFF